MIIISGTEFRNKQREYLDRVDAGEQVILHRGENKAYALTPISEDDMYFTSEMVQKLRRSIAQAEAGETIRFDTPAELNAYLDSL